MPRPHSMKTVATGGFFLCVFFNKTPQFFFSFSFFYLQLAELSLGS